MRSEYTCGRPLAPDRLLALPPIINGPSVRARPRPSVRASALCKLARPPARRHGGGTLGAQMFLAIPSLAATRSPSPLLSVFRDPRRSPGSPARSLAAFFVSPRITGRRGGRCTYSVNTPPSLARMDGWMEELVTHSGAIQLHSLSLSGVVIDGGGRTNGRRFGFIREASHVSSARPASV